MGKRHQTVSGYPPKRVGLLVTFGVGIGSGVKVRSGIGLVWADAQKFEKLPKIKFCTMFFADLHTAKVPLTCTIFPEITACF